MTTIRRMRYLAVLAFLLFAGYVWAEDIGDKTTGWSTSAGSNNAASPDGWPENMAPSGVNDSARENMRAIRKWYNDAQWIEYGDGDGAYTPTYVAGNQFKIEGVDVSSTYHVGRRVKLVASTPGTIYGTITAVSFSTDTTVTVTWDSGSLSNEAITSVEIGILSQTNPSIPDTIKVNTISELTAANGVVIDGVTIKDNGVTATGTSSFAAGTISDLGTVTTANIDGGSIDGTTIGSSSASTIVGTTITVNTNLVPDSNDGAGLGISGTAFSDLFLAGGAVVNFNAGDVTLTHSANALTVAGGTFSVGDLIATSTVNFNGATVSDLGTVTTADINGGSLDGATIGAASASTIVGTTITVNTNLVPDANDGAGLGISGTAFSDLFLASGGVINFNAGDVTITHSANALTVAGGTFTASDLIATSSVNFNGATVTDLGTVSTIDIDGGNIDGTVIGATTPATATVSVFTSNGINDDASSESIKISSAGEVTMANQPAFLAYNSSTDVNQTGNGAAVTVEFDTEVFDRNSDYNTTTDTFTAPVTGIYRFNVSVRINEISGASDGVLQIITSNRTYQLNISGPPDGAYSFHLSVLADMDAADTATVQVQVNGMAGGNVADVHGAASPITFFSGNLVM